MDTNKFIDDTIALIKDKVRGKGIIALSGGVDSSVCTYLSYKAISDNLYPVFIDTGLMRIDEAEEIKKTFNDMNIRIIDAKDRFLSALKGVTDPEKKRKVIGALFIRIFEEVAEDIGADYLIQGTIYPDVIESHGGIKSHHNVGGMPLKYTFKEIIEPLKDLYKDEVRMVARALSLPEEICERMPYPGPGLAVRIVGEVTEEKLDVVKRANKIVEDELKKYKPWQAFAALIGKGTGVKGDERVYGWIISVRAVESRDGMTADYLKLPWDTLDTIRSRITGEIRNVSRVVYDITPKPPATIEYE